MNDSTAYFKLMNDFDVNDTQWASNWTQATVEFLEFDGDGHEIRNINDMSAGTSIRIGGIGERYFKNIKLSNIIKNGGILFANSAASSLIFENVSFPIIGSADTVIFQNSSGGSSAYIYLNNSTISLTGRFKSICDKGSNGRIHINRCAFYFDNAIFDSNIFYNSAAAYGEFNKVAMIGKVNFPNAITAGRIINGVSAPQYCYIALDLSESVYKPTTFSYASPNRTCFYDKELLGYELTAGTYLYALTTEQCKDKDYLNSIGFVVV